MRRLLGAVLVLAVALLARRVRPWRWIVTGDAAMKLRKEQIAEARRLGVIVKPVRRTGEIPFLRPGEPPVTMNNRRTDGTRAVEKLITKRKGS